MRVAALCRETPAALHRVPLPVLFLRRNGETDVLAAAQSLLAAAGMPEATAFDVTSLPIRRP